MLRLTLGALLLASCTTPQAPTRWVGTVVPTTEGKTCLESRGVLQLADNHVLFAPDDGTWVLDGVLAKDGTITADRNGQGIDHKPYETNLIATRTAARIIGTYKTPRCTFDVVLVPT